VNRTHPAGEQQRQSPGSPYWLIAKDKNGQVEVLTIDLGDGEALPVFSYEEEAEMFLNLGGIADGWLVRQSGAREIVSVLCGPCASAGSVALDPLPEMVAEAAVGLVSLGREHFLNHLLGGRRASAP
jgi:hypothetical protein